MRKTFACPGHALPPGQTVPKLWQGSGGMGARCNKCDTKAYNIKDHSVPGKGKFGWEGYYQHELKQRAEDLAGDKPPSMTRPVSGVPGCFAYSGCKNDVQTWYCESDGPHPVWPGRNKEIISFLKAVKTD